MRCRYCGKELALLKRWTGGGEFCSDAHRQQYQEEYNQLALNRLLQAKPKSDPGPVVGSKRPGAQGSGLQGSGVQDDDRESNSVAKPVAAAPPVSTARESAPTPAAAGTPQTPPPGPDVRHPPPPPP